ncbi:MAG: LysE family transporter [Candidatus Njordarchaeia archaeon]
MLLSFFVRVVIISSSGALSPGPLTASAIQAGIKKGWKSGILESIGHSLVEFPLIALISLGIATILTNKAVSTAIGTIGSLILIYMGVEMIKNVKNGETDISIKLLNEKPLMLGILLTALNPYFIIWWVFVGGMLVINALETFGTLGIGILFIMHVWLDFAWLTLLAYLGQLGKNILKTKGYCIFMETMGLLFIIFGLNIITGLYLNIKILPF